MSYINGEITNASVFKRVGRQVCLYFGINNPVEGAIELDVDSHHGFAALNVKSVNMWRVLQIVIFPGSVANYRSRRARA